MITRYGKRMNASGIKLTDRNTIAEPSGRKVHVKELEVGRHYLYKNLYKYRLIIRLDGANVYYHDKVGPGMCSRQHFVTMCPHLATPQEVAFIDKRWDL